MLAATVAGTAFRNRRRPTGRPMGSSMLTNVRLKPNTTEDNVRLKPDTTEDNVRLKPDTTEDNVRLKPDTTEDNARLKRDTTTGFHSPIVSRFSGTSFVGLSCPA